MGQLPLTDNQPSHWQLAGTPQWQLDKRIIHVQLAHGQTSSLKGLSMGAEGKKESFLITSLLFFLRKNSLVTFLKWPYHFPRKLPRIAWGTYCKWKLEKRKENKWRSPFHVARNTCIFIINFLARPISSKTIMLISYETNFIFKPVSIFSLLTLFHSFISFPWILWQHASQKAI